MTVLMPKGSVVLSYSREDKPMNYSTYKQSSISDFFTVLIVPNPKLRTIL